MVELLLDKVSIEGEKMEKKNKTIDCTSYICSQYYFDDQLTLEINDIDDLAVAWIANMDSNTISLLRLEEENGKSVELEDSMWLWEKGGQHGKGKLNITQWLNNNYEKYFFDSYHSLHLVIAIYDFEYKHPILKGGKWSFDAKLTLNGIEKWNKHDFGESDTKNNIYGLKYLKIIRIILNTNNHKIILSETIEKSFEEKIFSLVRDCNNYIKNYTTGKIEHVTYKEPKNGNLDNKNFFFDIIFILTAFSAIYIFYNHKYVLETFISSNIIVLLYVFIRFKLGGKAWALVLRKKHDKELDSFMVVLGLLFSAAFGAITSFDFDADNLQNSWLYRDSIFFLYISTNIVFLYILTVISTYAVNALKANKPLLLFLIILIGLGIFIQETVNFEQNYKETINNIRLCGVSNATEK